MKTMISLGLFVWVGSATVIAQDVCHALRLQTAEQRREGATLTDPRVDHRIKSPGHDADVNGAIAMGHVFAEDWRVEGEDTLRKHWQLGARLAF